MVKTEDGAMKIVKPGDSIAKNGTVLEIATNRVVIGSSQTAIVNWRRRLMMFAGSMEGRCLREHRRRGKGGARL
ncbi:MAG: hypothetical protein ACYC69_09580 [Thermodesulfovibrionales bacterium]